jgi:hypothetical protein
LIVSCSAPLDPNPVRGREARARATDGAHGGGKRGAPRSAPMALRYDLHPFFRLAAKPLPFSPPCSLAPLFFASVHDASDRNMGKYEIGPSMRCMLACCCRDFSSPSAWLGLDGIFCVGRSWEPGELLIHQDQHSACRASCNSGRSCNKPRSSCVRRPLHTHRSSRHNAALRQSPRSMLLLQPSSRSRFPQSVVLVDPFHEPLAQSGESLPAPQKLA